MQFTMISTLEDLFKRPKECYIIGFGGFTKINPLHIQAILLLPNKKLDVLILRMDSVLNAKHINEITKDYKHEDYDIVIPHNIFEPSEDLAVIQSFLYDVYIHNPQKLQNLPVVFLPHISKIVKDYELNLYQNIYSLSALLDVLKQENFSNQRIDYSTYMMTNFVANNRACSA